MAYLIQIFFFKYGKIFTPKNKYIYPFPIQLLLAHKNQTEYDDGSTATTYLVTPSFTCQNPNHPHHRSHFAGIRSYPIEETVFEESTAGSIVTVIDTTSSTSTARLNDSATPDIILTNQSKSILNDFNDEQLSNLTTRALTIQSKKSTSATAAANQPSTSPVMTSSNSNLSHSNEAGTKSFKSKNKNVPKSKQLLWCTIPNVKLRTNPLSNQAKIRLNYYIYCFFFGLKIVFGSYTLNSVGIWIFVLNFLFERL